MYKFFFSILVLSGVLTIASVTTAASLPKGTAGQTPFETLKNFYDQSTTPAALTDFDWASDKNSKQICSAALSDSTAPYEVLIGRTTTVIAPGTPATPGQGPLFPGTPGTPDQKGTVLTFSVTSDRSSLASTPIGGTSLITTTSTDLVDTVTDQNNTESPIVMSARENGGLIALHVTINTGSAQEKGLYIYCYRQ